MSLPEVRLWQIFRARPDGIKFRRQYPIGNYVLDFYVPDARLAIEIDGIAHDMGNRQAHDTARDAWLADNGIAVLRISAQAVLTDPQGVAQMMVEHVAALRRPLHHPADGRPPHALGKGRIL